MDDDKEKLINKPDTIDVNFKEGQNLNKNIDFLSNIKQMQKISKSKELNKITDQKLDKVNTDNLNDSINDSEEIKNENKQKTKDEKDGVWKKLFKQFKL